MIGNSLQILPLKGDLQLTLDELDLQCPHFQHKQVEKKYHQVRRFFSDIYVCGA